MLRFFRIRKIKIMKKLILLVLFFGMFYQAQSQGGGDAISNKHPIAKANGIIDAFSYPMTRTAGLVEGEIPVYVWYNRDALSLSECSQTLNDLYVVVFDTDDNIIGSRSLADFVFTIPPSFELYEDISETCSDGNYGLHGADITISFYGECGDNNEKLGKVVLYEIMESNGNGGFNRIFQNTPCMEAFFPSGCFVPLKTQLREDFKYWCEEDDPDAPFGGVDPEVGGSGDEGHDSPKGIMQNNSLTLAPFTATPNPFDTHIDLQINSPAATTAQITLFDLQGRQLITRSLRFEKGLHSITIPTTDLPDGTYFLSWQTPTEIHTKRFLKHTP